MMVRTQFTDTFMTSMLPALDEVIFHRFTQHPPQYTKIFRVLDSNRSIEQTSDMADLGTFVEIPEGGDMRYDFAVQGFDKTYTHAQYGLGYKVSRIMVDDDRFERIVVLLFLGHGEQVAGVAQVGVDLGERVHDRFEGFFLFAEILGALRVVPDRGVF